METKTYLAIDLKSFYASVECVERGLDPLDTNLVVADLSRTEKTICLAVTPSLKAYGIPGRARLFEAIERINEVNALRLLSAKNRQFSGESFSDRELKANPDLKLAYITAPPQMRRYMEFSTAIYEIYLKYIAPEDIHVYSVDEVFIDATGYLSLYGMSARELITAIITDVYRTTGITATGGIGTNLYLCKIAMDIMAKRAQPDENGVRIASLDEMSYRRLLWEHRPLTDFWRIGRGYGKKLADRGIYTMGDIAKCSLTNSAMLYKLFGVNAEILIDHAWGLESVEMKHIKSYVPQSSSLSSGQVLKRPYEYAKARIVCYEMIDALTLKIVENRLVTNRVSISINYDRENVTRAFDGKTECDWYGRVVPRGSHSSVSLGSYTSSGKIICGRAMELFDEIAERDLTVRRITVAAENLVPEDKIPSAEYEQLTLFSDPEKEREESERENCLREKERALQEAVINMRRKYGKNAVLKAVSYEEGATAVERNGSIGGHRA